MPRFSLAAATGSTSCPRKVGAAALVVGAVAIIGCGTTPATPAPSSSALGALGPIAGTIFVANAGAIAQGAGGTGPGSITSYRPDASGDACPEKVISKGINHPAGITVDSSGNLWVANDASNVVEYSRSDLAKASPAPTLAISYAGSGLAFDSSGDLWVVNGTAVAEFTKAEIAKSGTPKPVVFLPNDCSVVFDSAGDLWEGSGADWLTEFTKAQLAHSASMSAPPQVTITSSSLSLPCRLVFDHYGDLWAGNYGTDTLIEFTRAELAESGSPWPAVTLTSPVFNEPGDVAIDRAGDLWVPTVVNGILGFTEDQLAKSGFPTPTFDIVGRPTGLNWPWGVAIEPWARG
jgi:streptogramin lyase